MSCPYLGESDSQDYCELAARKISTQRASGYCETMSYLGCEYYSSSDDDEKDEFED